MAVVLADVRADCYVSFPMASSQLTTDADPLQNSHGINSVWQILILCCAFQILSCVKSLEWQETMAH